MKGVIEIASAMGDFLTYSHSQLLYQLDADLFAESRASCRLVGPRARGVLTTIDREGPQNAVKADHKFSLVLPQRSLAEEDHHKYGQKSV